MGKYDKLYRKVIIENNRKDLTFDDFVYLVENSGGELRSIRGSHHVYTIKGANRPIPLEPDKNNMAKDYEVKEFQKTMKTINERKGEDNA